MCGKPSVKHILRQTVLYLHQRVSISSIDCGPRWSLTLDSLSHSTASHTLQPLTDTRQPLTLYSLSHLTASHTLQSLTSMESQLFRIQNIQLVANAHHHQLGSAHEQMQVNRLNGHTYTVTIDRQIQATLCCIPPLPLPYCMRASHRSPYPTVCGLPTAPPTLLCAGFLPLPPPC